MLLLLLPGLRICILVFLSVCSWWEASRE